jgi:hypothetical protein
MASLTAQLIGGPTILLEYAGLRWLTDPTLSPPGHYGWLDKTNGSAVEADQLRDPRGLAAVWGLIASFYGSPLATSDTRYLDAAGMWTLPTMTANTGLWPRVWSQPRPRSSRAAPSAALDDPDRPHSWAWLADARRRHPGHPPQLRGSRGI